MWPATSHPTDFANFNVCKGEAKAKKPNKAAPELRALALAAQAQVGISALALIIQALQT